MSDHEPESYDLNSMMNRLKQRSSDNHVDGELVTRADGTQAIRVRKRKRRSEQPRKNHESRVRMLQVTVALVAVLLLVIAAGCVLVYVNSSAFQKQVVKNISWSTGADVQLKQFRMNPSGGNAQHLELTWPNGNPIDKASFSLLKADVSPASFLSGKLNGQELEAQNAALVLRIPEEGLPARMLPKVNGPLPIHFNQWGVKNFSVQMKVKNRSMIRLDKSQASLSFQKNGSGGQLVLSRGLVSIPRWPKLRLDRALVEFDGQDANLVSARFKGIKDTKGTLELAGTISVGDAQEPSILHIGAEAFPLSALAGEDLGALFVGRMDSSLDAETSTLSLRFGESPEASWTLRFNGTLTEPFQIRNFPFLYGLSQTLEDEWFAQPEFEDTAEGFLVREKGRIGLKDLRFSSKGRMALRGELEMQVAGKLSGTLDVGIAHAMVTTSENQVLEKMFEEPQEGFRWLKLEIGGRVSNPTDNFSKLYEKALQLIKREEAEASSSQTHSFEDLTKPH